MQIKTSSGVHYVNANYVVEEKQGEYPKLTCTIAKKDNHWLDEVQELDRIYTEGEQDEFVIVNPVKITKGDSYDLEISAVGAFHFEFVKSYMYNELKTATYHIDYLLGKLFEGSRFVLELNGTFPTVEFEGFGKDDKLTLFERVMSRFGAEYKIVGKVVQVNNKIGNDTGFQFRYLKNIKDTEYSIDASEIATYAKGLGAWKDEEDHSKGRLEIEYKSSLYDIFGHLDYGTVEDERMYYADTLKTKCKSVLDATVSVTLKTTLVALQRQLYKAEAHIGDFIWFIDERINLEKKIRFAQIKTTYLSDDSILKQEVVLGDKDAYSKQKDNEAQSSAVVKQTSNQLSELAQKVDKTHVLAQNGVKIYFSDVMPVDEPKGTIRKGDKLYLDKNGKVLTYYWNGVQWELEPVVNDVEQFKQDIAQELEEVDAQLAAQSEAHNQAVAEILAQATSAEDLAFEAKRVGDQAVADAISLTAQLNTAKSSLQNQINKAKSDLQASVATADAKAEQVQEDVNQAKQDLMSQVNQLNAQATKQEELTKLTTETKKLVDGQITTISELSKTVAQNGKDIKSVESRTKTVEDTLSGTKTTLEQVKATAESTSQKTAEIESGIDGLNSKFEELKVADASFEQSLATYQQSAERNLADLQSTIQTLDGRVTSNKSNYDQDASKIATRLSSLETYKNAEGTRESKYFEAAKAETAKQLAAERAVIAKDYVAKSTYTSDVTGIRNDLTATTTTANTTKTNLANYQTSNDKAVANLKSSLQTGDGKISGLQTSLNAVPGQISAAVSAVETKIPTSIGGRNYIRSYGTIFNPSNLHTSSWKFETVDDPDAKSGKTVKATCTAAGSNGFHKVLYDLRGDSFDGRQMTYAVDIKVSKAVKLRMGAEIFQGGYKTFDATTSWQRFIHTGIVKLNRYYSFPVYIDSGSWSVGDVIWLRDPQLEDGSIATTAGPATEDIASDITQAKAEIKVNSDEIAKRLTKTEVQAVVTGYGYQTKAQVDSNITGRGYITSSALQPYATTSVLENKVKETASSFERQITETKSLIPASMSQRNLVSGTSNAWNSYLDITTNNNWCKDLGEIRYGDATGIYANSKVNVYVYISADNVVLDDSISNKRMILQGEILTSSGSWTWDNWTKYSPIYNKWTTTLKAGNNYHIIKVTGKVTADAYSNSKGFRIQIRIDGAKSGKFHWRALMVTTGDIFPDYWTPAFEDLTTVTAFNKVSETVDEYKRLISSGGSLSKAIQSAEKFEKSIASGGDIYQAIQTAKGLATTVSGTNGLSTQVSQLAGSYAIRNLTNSNQVLSQLNLNPDGSVRINDGLISIGDKTYIKNGVIKSAMIANGQIGTAHIGTIDASKANIINLNVKNIVGLDATFIKSKIELAIIDWIKGKTIVANNDAMKIDLNGGQILHYTEKAAMKRILTDYPTQFIKFATGTVTGKGSAGVTVIGSNRYGTESTNDGGFVGIRAWNGSNIDLIDVVGDTVRLASSAYDSADGWSVITLPNKLEIDAYNSAHRASSRIKVGDVWLWKNSTTYSSIRETINLIIDSLSLLHKNKTTATGYSYTLPAKV